MAESDSMPCEVRVCAKCLKEKHHSEFHKTKDGVLGRRRICKECVNVQKKEKRLIERERDPEGFAEKQRAYNLAWQLKNASKVRISRAEYKLKNAESVLAANNDWYAKNRKTILEKQKIYRDASKQKRAEDHKKWRHSNRDYVLSYWRKYSKQRLADDVIFAMRRRARHFIGMALLNMGYTKRSKSTEILGCSWGEFKAHIEMQFTNGMCWGNRSHWHIDHIIPLASAKSEQEVISLNHYTNLRPLLAVDNMKKGSRVDYLL